MFPRLKMAICQLSGRCPAKDICMLRGRCDPHVEPNEAPAVEVAKTFEMPALVEVVDCCGVYGWLIPWALWKCGRVPITSTRDFQRPYIYLYSIVGQLGHSPRAVIPRKRGEQPSYDVCLDHFIDFDSKQADWEGVRRDILAQAERRARAEQRV